MTQLLIITQDSYTMRDYTIINKERTNKHIELKRNLKNETGIIIMKNIIMKK